MNGNDLVAAKVKTVVWQGGWYPPIHGWGHHTYNWDCGAGFYNTDGCNGASEYAVNNMPPNVEMIYSDIGDEVISGRRLSTCTDERNPCRAALEDQQGWGNGRCSWDPIVTLKAIRPDSSDYAQESGTLIALCMEYFIHETKNSLIYLVHHTCFPKKKIFLPHYSEISYDSN